MERVVSGLQRMATRKSMKDMSCMNAKEFPPGSSNYEILDDCGRGVSATVHRALCRPINEICAIKRMNLESLNCDLEEIIHEAQTMKNYSHPNVLSLYGSFVSGQELWMIMPFISGGSVLHIMKYAHPDGLDEIIVATIMRDVLRALDYVHKQGGIHRDIKAGNILINNEGHVYLGDFGVAASMERTGSWGHDKQSRMTFVGTPCWMAPEVMEQTQGYDSSADIWSFGITLLEMAHGHAPFAKFPPMKILLMTLQNPPPTLDDKGKKHFSKAMREVVSRCLQKDPRLRPSAASLLDHKFFKQARDDKFVADHVMTGLPPLGERVQEIRQGRAATKASDNEKDIARSQEEYNKGVSSWNFDVNALKAQAALEPEDEENLLPTITESDETVENTLIGVNAQEAASFISAQRGQPITSPMTSATGRMIVNNLQTNSVFASLQGQHALLATTSTGPMVHLPILLPSGSGGVYLDCAVAADRLQYRPSQPGGESAPLSPSNLSPSALSAESSMQNLPQGSLSTTPTASKPKGTKQQGRFHIYEPGSEPPPMAPGVAVGPSLGSVTLDVAASGAVGGSRFVISSVHDFSHRMSEDGSRRLEPQESVVDDSMSVEPKKKGRFMVVEQAGISKTTSLANLNSINLNENNSKSRPDLLSGKDPLGKPPTAPTGSSTAGTLPANALLPKLQELLEHAAAHYAGLQRLVGAVGETERGRLAPMFSRAHSTRSLFTDAASGGRGPSPSEAGEGEAAALDLLRQRITELEADNMRLRHRNQQLESAAISGGGAAFPGGSEASGPGFRPPSSISASYPVSAVSNGDVPQGLTGDRQYMAVLAAATVTAGLGGLQVQVASKPEEAVQLQPTVLSIQDTGPLKDSQTLPGWPQQVPAP